VSINGCTLSSALLGFHDSAAEGGSATAAALCEAKRVAVSDTRDVLCCQALHDRPIVSDRCARHTRIFWTGDLHGGAGSQPGSPAHRCCDQHSAVPNVSLQFPPRMPSGEVHSRLGCHRRHGKFNALILPGRPLLP
jgi:hypothetical protein